MLKIAAAHVLPVLPAVADVATAASEVVVFGGAITVVIAFPNGRAPRAALARVYYPTPAVQPLLERHAAAAWNTMVVCAYDAGRPPVPGRPGVSAYRTLAQQVVLRAYWTNARQARQRRDPRHEQPRPRPRRRPRAARPDARWIDAHGALRLGEALVRRAVGALAPALARRRLAPRPRTRARTRTTRACRSARAGAASAHVRGVQRALGQHADRRYTAATAAAVKRFQRRHGIPPPAS
jgi:peptidoglycan hydrolase-like protein with peptidoglycan-binding domain